MSPAQRGEEPLCDHTNLSITAPSSTADSRSRRRLRVGHAAFTRFPTYRNVQHRVCTQEGGNSGEFLYCGMGMSLQLRMEEKPDYLVASFIGSGVVEEAWSQFELIAENCKRKKNNKLLIDATRAEVKVSLVERFLSAERTLIFAQYGLKVAFVEIPERIDPQRFGELVARNRGVNIRGFLDYQAAVNWLLE